VRWSFDGPVDPRTGCAETVLAMGGAAMAFTLTSGTLDEIGEGGYGC
jgi:hypothetical protein